MKLLQLNIWQGRLILNILKFLEKEQPDILCLQEVLSAKETVEIPNNMCNSFELIRQKTGYDNTFFSADLRTTFAGTSVAFGNAILSKYPLGRTDTVWINGGPVQDQTHENFIPHTSNLQIAEVQLPHGKKATIVNHHGYWEPDPKGSVISRQKFQLVADTIRDLPCPMIVTGDLNVTHQSPALAPLETFLNDLTYDTGLRTTLTELNAMHGIACDHVMVSDDVQVRSLTRSDMLLSDHAALLLEFNV
jgi:endonuclease/exonuclease/phosphatase family metal-dependent hydrolase